MSFSLIDFIFNRNKKQTSNIINLIDYHYKVDNIYNDLIFVSVDVDYLDIKRFEPIKLLNTEYLVRDVEFLPYNKDFKYKLTLIPINT